MNYLLVVAHPDDEILGAGGSVFELNKKGDNVYVCTLSRKCRTRYDMSSDLLYEKMNDSHEILGVKKDYTGTYKCLCFKDESHQDMVEFIEATIRDCKPDVVITHHPADINNDHYITSIICQTAVRLPQRLLGYDYKIKKFMFMEVATSTDWYLNQGMNSFMPNAYFEISEEAFANKIKALEVYEENDVIRKMPHPRSVEALRARAIVRGSASGVLLAEAFQTVFQLEEIVK